MPNAALPIDHPLRLTLADEVHARPSEPLDTPARATYLALLIDEHRRDEERAHVAALCAAFDVAPPAPDATHFGAQLGSLRFRWERHGEFSGFTLIAPGASAIPFEAPASALLPAGWLSRMPGQTMVALHADVVDAIDPDPTQLAAWFGGNLVIGGEVGGGTGRIYTDFRVHADGFGRFVVCDRGFTSRQAGRTVQRLFEIEAYRMMTLLALPIARELTPRIGRMERTLADVTGKIASARDEDESLLREVTALAADIETSLVASQFRFGACRAYHALVTTRIAELRETRLPGIQPIHEFMARRLAPAVATCATASQRLHELSERVAQASALLSTRVDITRERQNQALLASMDRRGRQQLRLQQTVEGLSVAAIVYYVVGLLGYLAKAGKASGFVHEPDLLVGLALPVVAVIVIGALRRARRRLHADRDVGSPA